jgi:GntR family transcriptional regulator of arabinose operon
MQGVYRYSGFVEQLQKLKLRINDDRILWYSTESREQTIASGFLHIIDGCDALVCYNDEVALQAIELLANNNIQIPKEVAVISFDNSSYSELAPIKITSYANDEFLLGQLAATKLMSLLEGAKEASVVSPWKIVEKDST